MTRVRPLRSLAPLLLAALALSGCEHKDLCYHHPVLASLTLQFDWSCAPDAQPGAMAAIFFPAQGEPPSNYRRFLFRGRVGGPVSVPCGRYNLVCYNADTEVAQLRNAGDFLTFEAYTRRGGLFEHIWGSFVSGPVIDDEQLVVLCPEMMWGSVARSVEVAPDALSYVCVSERDKGPWLGQPAVRHDYTITLSPHELVCHYSYEIRHVSNLRAAKRLSGALSGMGGRLRFSDENVGDTPSILPFPARAQGDSTIVGEFLTFGHNDSFEKPANLVIYAWMGDDSQYVFGRDGSMDATPQILAAPDRRHVHLVFDGLAMPEAYRQGDYTPGFDDWGEEYHDIDMK